MDRTGASEVGAATKGASPMDAALCAGLPRADRLSATDTLLGSGPHDAPCDDTPQVMITARRAAGPSVNRPQPFPSAASVG
jgi:hypothetical protein